MMDGLINQLYKVCKEYPLEEKMLIVDTYSIAQEIKLAYVENHGHAIHLKTITVHDLAVEVMEMKTNQVFTLLEQAVGIQFVYQILTELNENKQLTYFRGLEVTPTFSRCMYQSIAHLRLAGYTSKTLLKEAFISTKKAEDFVRIMNRYEKVLDKYQLIDEADLLRHASALAQPKNKTIFILQSKLFMSQLANDFLQKLLLDNVFKLPLPFVYGVTIPKQKDFRSIEWGEKTPFSYLYHLEELPKKPHLTLFTAKTEEVEIKQVLGQIKQLQAPLDENTIYYTKMEPYVTTIFQLSEKYQIPVTFAEGISILYSQPGRLVAGLIKWMKEDYSVPIFIELMQGGLLALPEEAPSKNNISRYLRDAQVGWNRSRYTSQLERLKNQMQQRKLSAKDQEQADYYQKQITDITWLQTWFTQLFKHLPLVGTEINYYTLLSGISSILKKQATTASFLDELAKAELLEQIKVILPYANESLSKFVAFEKVKELLLMLRVNQSGPKPGHLHISSYKKGIYHNRKHVFIVGLDNRTFPGTGDEDPLLLDEERRQLSDFLPILQESGNENLYTMLQLLSQTKGPVSFSYCSYAINDNRTMSPAHLFLQGYRMITEQPNADFKDLENLPSPVTATDIFEDKDYWNIILEQNRHVRLGKKLKELYPNLMDGKVAEEARNEGRFTVFDGRVNIDTTFYDPRENKDRVLSSGKLEKLATCPYAYFLQDILKLTPIEETIFDPYSWLNAPTRGSLLHSIFETFYQTHNGKKPIYEADKKRIIKIAREKIAEQKLIYEPPSERVFEREVNDIYQCCLIFLKEEETYSENYQAKYFEYAFGLNGEEPANITLPSGKTIGIRGIVDRVDQSNDGYFHIIDYKTGSTYNYQDRKHFQGGRQLQHFIYALAIEAHLKLEAGTVQESSYYFPSVRGLGERFVRKQNDVLRTNGFDMLEKLIDIIKHGDFTMTDDVKDCKFCDFKAVCRRDFYLEETLRQKQGDHQAEGVVKFKGVRAYD